MSVVNLFRNGGQMVGDVEEIKGLVVSVIKENDLLKGIIERQGAIIVSIKDEIGTMSRKLDSIQDEVTYSKNTTDEIKHTKFVGQTMKLLPTAVEKAKQMSGKQIRQLIHKAAQTHGSGRRKGYTYLYNKIIEVTGFDVYEAGQVRLRKSDNIDGWKKDPSYINSIFKHGKQVDAAVVSMQILADK